MILNDFFQLIRRLEKDNYQWNSCDNSHAEYKMQCSANYALTFPIRIINSVNIDDNNMIHILVNYLGLIGVDSPLPFYWSLIAQDVSDQAEKVRAFLNIFQQRIYYLYYLSWKKHRIIIQHEQKNSPFFQYLQAISGGILHAEAQYEFACASLFGQRVHNAFSLLTILNHFYKSKAIAVKQFIPQWICLSQAHCLSYGNLMLSRNAVIGRRVLSVSQCLAIEFGPIHLQNSQSIIKNYVKVNNLLNVIKKYSGLIYRIELKMHVFIEKHSSILLGKQPNYLGQDTFLGNINNQFITFKLI